MIGCVFCDKIAAGGDEHGPVMDTADAGTVMFEPLNPITPGHMLFVPRGHMPDAAEHPWVTGKTAQVAAAYAFVMAEPFNLITSAGTAATQTVRHLHWHYVPRRDGDMLTLPWSRFSRVTGRLIE